MEGLGPEDLKKSLVFHNLDPEDAQRVIGLAERRVYNAGDVVFSQDEEAKELFVVEKGLVGIIVRVRPNTQLTVSTESKGAPSAGLPWCLRTSIRHRLNALSHLSYSPSTG